MHNVAECLEDSGIIFTGLYKGLLPEKKTVQCALQIINLVRLTKLGNRKFYTTECTSRSEQNWLIIVAPGGEHDLCYKAWWSKQCTKSTSTSQE